jgi:hypothetical protein
MGYLKKNGTFVNGEVPYILKLSLVTCSNGNLLSFLKILGRGFRAQNNGRSTDNVWSK